MLLFSFKAIPFCLFFAVTNSNKTFQNFYFILKVSRRRLGWKSTKVKLLSEVISYSFPASQFLPPLPLFQSGSFLFLFCSFFLSSPQLSMSSLFHVSFIPCCRRQRVLISLKKNIICFFSFSLSFICFCASSRALFFSLSLSLPLSLSLSLPLSNSLSLSSSGNLCPASCWRHHGNQERKCCVLNIGKFTTKFLILSLRAIIFKGWAYNEG